MVRRVVLVVSVLFSLALLSEGGVAQQAGAPAKKSTSVAKKKSGKAKKSQGKITRIDPASIGFRPTCTFDSNTVGAYFFPANLGAKWTMRIVRNVFDGTGTLVQVDTSYSFERVVADSNRTLQGAPVLTVESSLPYPMGSELNARVQEMEYYVDDSVIMTVTNHSLSSGLNRYLLVNPLRVGARWRDKLDDSIVTEVLALKEPVTTPVGAFDNALVVQTRTPRLELSKYFVPGYGIVKTVFRGSPANAPGTLVITSELIKLERGDESRNIRYRFGTASR